MLVTVTSTGTSATNLSHLLRTHPDRAQAFPVSVGTAHVFYPEASNARCTVAMLLEVDPIGLVRDKRFRGSSAALGRYVNDRPYASSSMVAVALGKVFRTAMNGTSDSFPELVETALPLEISVSALPARGRDSAGIVTALFAPLGWEVEETAIPLDSEFPLWGPSPYVDLTLRGEVRLGEALRHLYVLLPVLDDAKHYWVSEDEIGKLLRAGAGWLPDHPERDLITRRYLAHQRSMVDEAAGLLALEARVTALDDVAVAGDLAPDAADKHPRPLAPQRADAVLAALHDVGARTVADVGCGEGELLKRLLADPRFTTVIGTDVSAGALARADRALNLREASDRQRERMRLMQSSVTYQDDRLADLDALVLMEVIEHLDLERLPALETAVFGTAAPRSVIVTTPNCEYNSLFSALPVGVFRHPDHRFEWSRAELAEWADGVAERHGYSVEYRTIGEVHPELGSASQLALFRKDPTR